MDRDNADADKPDPSITHIPFPPRPTVWTRIAAYLKASLNFYRVHTLIFTFVPLIFSGLLYASNGEHHISYIDCLFTCVSAFCVCGLATIDLSRLTFFQQFLIFLLMNTGSTTFVSFWMVAIRRHYFAQEFRFRIQEGHLRDDPENALPWRKRLVNTLTFTRTRPQEKLHRTLTVPLTVTYTTHAHHPHLQHLHHTGHKIAPYLTFDALAGRNSAFPHLTHEQLEEIGGVEYSALCLLLWLVGGLWFGSQLIAFIVIAPYMTQSRWADDLRPPALHREIPTTWFSLFQVVSAYTNSGMSLVDQSMVPFQTAYPMILAMCFLVLCGNTSFPLFLRLLIWTLTKILPAESRHHKTLKFLLDHPRRCYIYLFPSHQTWFLLLMVVALNSTDWLFFLVLDIGTPAIDSIKLGTRFAIGLLQAMAVRAAGFATVTISELAPAVKVLYVLMMYVSVYPIAMSVRSTNVYEERSIGVFHEEDEDEEKKLDNEMKTSPHRVAVWGKFLATHARKQLSFDMWWLGLALFLVCIVERKALDKEENASWFNIFNILFELVSAYGGVGLSVGLPFANYSFSGSLSGLSKLIVCGVIIRGRHRGLPVAIDRAVVFPYELHDLKKTDGEAGDAASAGAAASGVDLRSHRTRTSFAPPNEGRANVGMPRTRTKTSQLLSQVRESG